jgi:hypothetical protein
MEAKMDYTSQFEELIEVLKKISNELAEIRVTLDKMEQFGIDIHNKS